MTDSQTCDECNVELTELDQTEIDGQLLCDSCRSDYISGQLRPWWLLNAKSLAGLVAAGVMAAALWWGPGLYLDHLRTETIDDCLATDPDEPPDPPESCLSHVNAAEWVGFLPWMTDRYEAFHIEQTYRILDSQLAYVSTVEPSARRRSEVLEHVGALADAHRPPRSWRFDHPGTYLFGIGETLRSNRDAHVQWAILAPHRYTGWETIEHLLKTAETDSLRRAVIEKFLARLDRPHGPGCLGSCLTFAAEACRAGNPETGLRLADARADEVPPTDGTHHRERVLRRVRLLQTLCADGTDAEAGDDADAPPALTETWWRHPDQRTRLLQILPPYATLATTLAHLAVDDEAGPDQMATAVFDYPDEFPKLYETLPASEQTTALLDAFADATDRRLDETRPTTDAGPPFDLAELRTLASAPPDLYRRAARAVEASDDAFETEQTATALARAFRLHAVVAAVRLGREETALTLLDHLAFPEDSRHLSFRASVHRWFGHPAEAADLLDEALEHEPEASLHLRRVTSLMTAGDFEGARRAHAALTDMIPPKRSTKNLYTFHRTVGLGYALAVYADGLPDELLADLLPERFHPAQLEESVSDHLADDLLRLFEMATASPERRRQLRARSLPDSFRDAFWYHALVATAVSPSDDEEVWLDHTLGRELQRSQPRHATWMRAELARLRDRPSDADRWMTRTAHDLRDVATDRDLMLLDL